ncbi:S8/S53 family peptidase [Fibrella forsythiae]|uniref:S8/S53 family peptidase n=1 Tax=Fibrella forsythiae TaxID=2817061 RepID=A0ABS3JKT9_9BACT|nr:S8/S53 family peptidase [Fibrella forsythiae]MBO0950616.1 S8/S53 family peptidase [Fibrella forsythiae]
MKLFVNDLILEGQPAALVSLLSSEGLTNESLSVTTAWDKAHQAIQQPGIDFAEPDKDNYYVFDNPAYDAELFSLESADAAEEVCRQDNDYDTNWPFPKQNELPSKQIWHLDAEFAQLKVARDQVQPDKDHIVRIAHLDTGYDPTHDTFPDTLVRHDLERNFIEGELGDNAADRHSNGFGQMPGHGTGTLCILAGKRIKLDDCNFDDSIGLASHVEIVPIRIAKSVVLFRTRAFVQALEYVISLYDDTTTRCHIVTMSMGGLASQAWADVVNQAYEKGIFIVSAAGNNFGRVTPRTLVYPARFGRVVAACGVTFDGSPYYRPHTSLSVMQGNFGPRRCMGSAIAAFTPNVPWAKIDCDHIVSLAGAGTSSATPQVAAAAALYRLRYFSEIDAMPFGWQRVEAIRHALFTSACPTIAPNFNDDVTLYFGAGVLKAADLLAVLPNVSLLNQTLPDTVSFPLLSLLAGFITLETIPKSKTEQSMFEIEVQQLIQQSLRLQQILDNEEKQPAELLPPEERAFLHTILAMPEASERLKAFIRSYNP